ncbi:MAG: hypothetical protein PHU64_07135 [Candidatus Omnitrophica bacterium]|nr:hypothetical protein [Candidatus Omnitrophota bacterium]MDD5429375.1 hypothetical protein [Candidatus Omnitrophota bacterium]
MDVNEKYSDFLKSLRIAAANSSVYFKEHPVFLKSVKQLKVKTEDILVSVPSIKINVAYDYLSFEGVDFKNAQLYQDINIFFHRRKIKSIEIKKGLSQEELSSFLVSVNLPAKDIFARGGLNDILGEQDVSNIKVEILDYSELLKNSDQDYRDIWLYVLRKSMKSGDSNHIFKLADEFEKSLANLGEDKILEDEGLGEGLSSFLSYLKKNDTDRFSRCLKGLVSFLLLGRSTKDKAKNTDKFRIFANDLSVSELSTVLLDKLRDTQNIDSLSFNLFFQLVDREKHNEVSLSLAEKLKNQEWLKNSPQIAEKIKNLFSLPSESCISDIYHKNLFSMLEDIGQKGVLNFDRKHLNENYKLILLDAFIIEKNKKRALFVLEKIFLELSKAIKNGDELYIKNFVTAVQKKENEADGIISVDSQAAEKISMFIEKSIFSSDVNPLDLKSLLKLVKKSVFNSDVYLRRIFEEERVEPHILTLFFQFFPFKIDSFCDKVKSRANNIKFTIKIIESLKEFQQPWVLKIIESVFSTANDFLKIEILKIIKGLSFFDEEFLLGILKKENFLQRQYALSALLKFSNQQEEAAKALLSLSNPFGTKTKRIMDNLRIVEAMPFEEAKIYLEKISRFRFFWNRSLRKKALEVIESYAK